MKRAATFWGICCISLLCTFSEANAQQAGKAPDSSKTQIQREYEFLKEQTQEYRQFIETERREHRAFIETMYTIVAALVGATTTIAAVILTFLGIKSRKDIKGAVKKLFDDHGLTLVDQRNESIKISVNELRALLEKETNYKKKSILFFTSPADQDKFSHRELPIIDGRGISNYQVLTELSQALPRIKNETFDAIVYYYNPPAEKEKAKAIGDTNLQTLLQFLQDRRTKTPLIVYTYEKGEGNQLYAVDRDIVVAYPYAVFTNFPITLVNLLHIVSNYFPVTT